MLRIVLVNENEENIRSARNMIAGLFMEKDIAYKCYRFSKNDEKLEKYISNKNKQDIFVIVDSKNIDSIEIMNKIRKKYHNIAPFIIIVDTENEKRIKDLKNKVLYNTEIITDLKSQTNKIKQVVNEVLDYFNLNKECLMLKKNNIIYKIAYSDILYIEKEANSKLCNIHCKTEVLKFYISLNKIKDILNKSFIQTHRSFIVNKNNILKMDLEKGTIRFITKEEKYAISRSYKKELKETYSSV